MKGDFKLNRKRDASHNRPVNNHKSNLDVASVAPVKVRKMNRMKTESQDAGLFSMFKNMMFGDDQQDQVAQAMRGRMS